MSFSLFNAFKGFCIHLVLHFISLYLQVNKARTGFIFSELGSCDFDFPLSPPTFICRNVCQSERPTCGFVGRL